MSQDFSLYRKILNHSHWQTGNSLLPQEIAEWLLHLGSLTEKLQSICPCVQVKVVNEGWQAVNVAEKSAKHWIREVVLKCGKTDWIFAQTILPQATIEHVAQPVLTLGENAIGLWLFPQNPERISLEWRQEFGLYARRSELRLKGYPIEIKELFLKDFPFNYETNNTAL